MMTFSVRIGSSIVDREKKTATKTTQNKKNCLNPKINFCNSHTRVRIRTTNKQTNTHNLILRKNLILIVYRGFIAVFSSSLFPYIKMSIVCHTNTHSHRSMNTFLCIKATAKQYIWTT